mmetsp:Transcript_92079/g.223546  ORF Transcript_92079/g.223546 Transcript_92079/m.223546 type:complete len:658 (-) Transcript_92079:335-2308(-)
MMRSSVASSVALAAALALTNPDAALARQWIPKIHGTTYKQGGTLMNQNGAPTTSQLAVNAESLNNTKTGKWDGLECLLGENGEQTPNPAYVPAGTTDCASDGYSAQVPSEFIAITDHSVSLVAKAGEADSGRDTAIKKQWAADNWSGMGSTNWGGTSGNAMAQAYMSSVGDQANENTGNDAAKSTLSMAYISYFMKNTPGSKEAGKDIDLRENQFLVSLPGGVNQYVAGCPNIAPGKTSADMKGVCPSKTVKPGAFKFSILGRLSGTMINSDETDFNVSTSGFASSGQHRDMAKYKTLLYRTTVDVGSMSAASKAAMKVVLKDGTVKPFSDFDAADNDIDISGGTLKIGHLEVAFEPNLSMGRYAIPKDTLKKDLPGGTWPCTQEMDGCTFDYTGFKDSPNAFPMGANLGVKKMGNGCQTKAWCEAWKDFADTGSDEKKKQIADAMTTVYAGCESGTMVDGVCPQPAESSGVKLDVTQVVAMRVTMRKSTGCDVTKRPAVPDGLDMSGQAGASWTSLPPDHDCPWWILATQQGQPLKWAIPAAQEDFLSKVSIKLEDKTNCASGDCYLVDFHIPLEDANGQRTVLGSVENDFDRGWQKGSFFMYDPEVKTPMPPVPPTDGKDDKDDLSNKNGATAVSGSKVAGVLGVLLAVVMACAT